MTEIYEICGYVPYSAEEITFALPIFRTKQSDGKFIQIPDALSTKISDFERVDEPLQSIAFSRGTSLFKPGMSLQYLLIDQDKVYFGTLASLENVFLSLLNRDDVPKSVGMQIAELIGDAQGLERSLSSYLQLLSGDNTVIDSKFVENSVIRNHVWSRLAKVCRSRRNEDVQSFLKRVLVSVSVIDGFIDFDQDLKKDLVAQLDINIEEFLRDVNDSFIFSDRLMEYSVSEDDAEFDIDIMKEKIREIRKMSRQETRLGRLIKGLIENDQLGKAIIENYIDRASFANVAIRYIAEFYDRFGKESWDEYAVHIVDWLYRECYPKQRGILLHELAVELGQYPSFSQAIENKLRQSYAQSVFHARKLIRLQLAHPEKRIGKVFAETSNTLPHVEKYFDEEEA